MRSLMMSCVEEKKKKHMGTMGIEPMTNGLLDQRSTDWAMRPHCGGVSTKNKAHLQGKKERKKNRRRRERKKKEKTKKKKEKERKKKNKFCVKKKEKIKEKWIQHHTVPGWSPTPVLSRLKPR